MGLLTTLFNQLTAPARDFKFALMRVKTTLLQPLQRLLGLQRGVASDVQMLKPRMPDKPKL